MSFDLSSDVKLQTMLSHLIPAYLYRGYHSIPAYEYQNVKFFRKKVKTNCYQRVFTI